MIADLCELAPAHVRGISPYIPGKPISELERELGVSNITKLASNENPLGASPKAMAAAKAALEDVHRYPDGNGFELKAAICDRYGLQRDQIVLGNGSNDVLELVARAFLAPNLAGLYSQYAFAVYPLVIQAVGANRIEAPAKNWGHDLAAMQEALTDETRVVFIANPNNPTGTLLSQHAIESFMNALPSNILVVLDEAYTEYLPAGLQSDSISLLPRYPNLLVTRTFSKAFGLAGFRVGFAACHRDLADMMNRVRQPFNVNSIALAAASAALFDEQFLARSRELNFAGMEQLRRGLDRLGLEHIPSYGNFLSFALPHAAATYQRLLQLGVIARPIANYEMPNHLRVSIGLESDNNKFLTALEQAIGEPA